MDVENVKILVFNNIRNGLLACKPLADAWLKNISQASSEQRYRYGLFEQRICSRLALFRFISYSFCTFQRCGCYSYAHFV